MHRLVSTRHWAAALGFVATLGASQVLGQAPAPAPQARQEHNRRSFLVGMADLFSPGVARLRAVHGDAQAGEGDRTVEASAFFMGPGRFITSRHALHGAREATVTMDSGQSFAVVRVLAEDVEADLVMGFIEIPAKLRRGLRISPLPPFAGEEGLLIGLPTLKPAPDPPGQPEASTPPPLEPEHPLHELVFSGEQQIGTVPTLLVGEGLIAGLDASLVGSPVISISGQVTAALVTLAGEDGKRTKALVAGPRLGLLLETPGLPLAEWSAGASLEAVAQAMHDPKAPRPRPEGFPPPPTKLGQWDVIPSGIERGQGDELRLDGRFTVTGAGTRDDPALLPWDVLSSLQETFKPRQGLSSIPERVAMYDGKIVRLTGFVSFPFVSAEARELLLMLNAWDGCCIGVPPTPYDAIEVLLAKPAKGNDLFTNYGTITGRLRVDPYLVGNWLVGMYVLEDATLTPAEYDGFEN